jgi:hypothetical protein
MLMQTMSAAENPGGGLNKKIMLTGVINIRDKYHSTETKRNPFLAGGLYTVDELVYFIIFGTGSIGVMKLASGLFSIPFSKRITNTQSLQTFLIIISPLLCLLYGGKAIY